MGTKVSSLPSATAVNPGDSVMIIQGGVNKKISASLLASAISAGDTLTKIKTVDGTGSGLDADVFQGNQPSAFATASQGAKADNALPSSTYTAANVLSKLLTVDGAGSGLDADKLDGFEASYFQSAAAATTAFSGAVSAVLQLVFPIGSVYTSTSNGSNPAALLGFGTWVGIGGARCLISADANYPVGTTGGEVAHTLTVNEMPSHAHSVNVSAATTWQAGPSQANYPASNNPSDTSSVGGGAAHNNMPPYLSVYMWQRTA